MFVSQPNQTPQTIIEELGGTIRMSEAINAGINRYTLYSMLKKGELEQLSRGVYRLANLADLSEPDLVIVATRIPRAVICLISALSYHDMTTQIPHEISIALPTGVKAPNLDHPPIIIHRFNKQSYEAGIETHLIDGIPTQIYNPEKTLVDCFKFRNKIGVDVVLEALKIYREKQAINIGS
ncbi:MAG TPA: transcriptional regulator, partial [Thiothrix sp.]|nr:transcriptional regulator [Thiothrix sp.]